MVVSAHLDDAVLSCFGALGRATIVLTVLAGVPPRGVLGSWDAEGGASDSHDRVLERREEDKRALLLPGSRHLHLDFPDRQYWHHANVAAVSLQDLALALRPVIVGVPSLFAPAGIWNEDHKLVRDAVLSVRPDAILYADLPYALDPSMGGFTLPAELMGQRRKREERLGWATATSKVESCRCYVTQLRQLEAIFGSFLNRTALSREVFWDFEAP